MKRKSIGKIFNLKSVNLSLIFTCAHAHVFGAFHIPSSLKTLFPKLIKVNFCQNCVMVCIIITSISLKKTFCCWHNTPLVLSHSELFISYVFCLSSSYSWNLHTCTTNIIQQRVWTNSRRNWGARESIFKKKKKNIMSLI